MASAAPRGLHDAQRGRQAALGRQIQRVAAFVPVGEQKFAVLSVATFGVYAIYWFYKNWSAIRDAQAPHHGVPDAGRRIVPLWRASLAPFYGISLLAHIRRQAEAEAIPVTWNATVLGVAFFAISMMAFLPDPWWLVSVGMFAPLLPPVRTCNEMNLTAEDPDEGNEDYTAANIATTIIGGLVWVLVIFSMSIKK